MSAELVSCRRARLRLAFATVLALAAVLAPLQGRASAYGPEYDAAFRAMMAEPTDLDIAFEFAAVARRAGDLEGAVGALERMLIYNPDLPVVHYQLALLYAGLGSVEAAKRYCRSALNYGPPPQIRARIEAELAQLEEASRASTFSGGVLLGFRHQTNANAAPDDPAVRVGGFPASLADGFLEREDSSILVSAGLSHRWDLRRDPAVFLVSDLQVYGARQDALDSQDIDLVAATVGPQFARPGGGMLRPFLRGDWIQLDGEALYRSVGLGISWGGPLSWLAGSRWSVEAAGMHRDYRKSARSPAIDNRDGENYRVGGNLRASVDPALYVEGFGHLERQDSDAGYESWRAVRLGMRAVRRLPAPVGEGAWELSLTGDAGIWGYESPDPTVDPGESRSDEEFGLTMGLTMPLSGALSAVLEVRRQWRRSNLPNFEFDNTSALAGVRAAF